MFRDESEALLKELSITLEAERVAERDRLEVKQRQDMEYLKARFEEDLQTERRRLQKEREEKLSSLKDQVTSDDAGLLVLTSFFNFNFIALIYM